MTKKMIKLLAIECFYYILLVRIISIYVIDIVVTPQRWNKNLEMYLNLPFLILYPTIIFFVLHKKNWEKNVFNITYKTMGLLVAVFAILDALIGFTTENYIPYISIILIIGISCWTFINGMTTKVKKSS